jgi:hypothetical protein
LCPSPYAFWVCRWLYLYAAAAWTQKLLDTVVGFWVSTPVELGYTVSSDVMECAIDIKTNYKERTIY